MHPLTRWIIDRTPDSLKPAVGVTARTVDAAIADRLPGLASELAFWVVLSLPALLLTAVAGTTTLGRFMAGDWQDELVGRFAEVASVALTDETVDDIVLPLVEGLLAGAGFGVVSIAFVATLWTASRAVKVVIVTLTLVYGREDRRPGWQARLLGFGLTLAAILAGMVLAPLLLAGPNLIAMVDRLATAVDLSRLDAVWAAAYWPSVIVLATLAIAAVYHLGVPGGTRRWRDELPGAILATAVWLAGSAGLRLYGAWILGSGSVYGPLAGPIVGLLWLWVTGFAVLLGAELNAQREQIADGAGTNDRDAAVDTDVDHREDAVTPQREP